MLRALGHFGAFAGLYVAAALVCFWQLAGVAPDGRVVPPWDVVCAVALMASGVYALDRMKLRDGLIDPADRAAQPERYAFVDAHSRSMRLAAAACVVGGSAIGMWTSVWAGLAGVLAVLGVVVYAPGPRRGRARLKDVAGLKNVYVAGGIAGFAALATVASAAHLEQLACVEILARHWPGLISAGALVGMRVLLDAALCDLDDAEADRAHGTATLPTMLGESRAWALTGAARVAVLIATLACPRCPWRARVAWCVAGVLGMLMLRVRRPGRVRDVVDLRLASLAIVTSLSLWWWR